MKRPASGADAMGCHTAPLMVLMGSSGDMVRPRSSKSSAAAACVCAEPRECPKGSAIQDVVRGAWPRVPERKARPRTIWSSKSSCRVMASSGCTHPPPVNSNCPLATSARKESRTVAFAVSQYMAHIMAISAPNVREGSARREAMTSSTTGLNVDSNNWSTVWNQPGSMWECGTK